MIILEAIAVDSSSSLAALNKGKIPTCLFTHRTSAMSGNLAKLAIGKVE